MTPKLSDREKQVLRGVLASKTYAEIAKSLGIGLETVRTHSKNLRKKTGVPNKVGLALWATTNLGEAKPCGPH